MGGIYTRQLRASVTHLVTDIVMSAKYEVFLFLHLAYNICYLCQFTKFSYYYI